jgi:3',5'-cyclic AMP phosphodiesterase CpdA
VTPIQVRGLRDLAGKRALGWLSWHRRRRHEHRAEILDALLADLAAEAPDHVAVTGDLTNVGLPDEIEAAVPWLERLGGPGRVSLVPGNHDAYGAALDGRRLAPWAPYMAGADGAAPGAGGRFPFVRRLGPLALVGLSSAVPSAPGLATGRLGADQLAQLERALAGLARERCYRVVLLHHPPLPAGQSWRRRLSDAPELRAILARTGAELVLHGHTHRTSFERVPGPAGAIPVVGVPSSSARGHRPERRARYHLYRIEAAAGAGFRLACSVRALDPGSGRFTPGPTLAL